MQDAVNRELRVPDFAAAGERMHALAAELYPDLPQPHRRWRARHARPDAAPSRRSTCTRCRPARRVFDWTIPKEWNIRAAHIKDAARQHHRRLRQLESARAGYSVPVRQDHAARRAQRRISTPCPSSPTSSLTAPAIGRRRGASACRTRKPRRCRDGDYEVLIDSSLADGALTYGEYLHVGASDGGVPAHRPYLPSLARQRQLLGARAADDPRPAPAAACARG